MNKRKSLILHFDSLDVIDELDDKQKAELFVAIRDYNLGLDVKLSGLMKAVFIPFKNQFDRDLEKYKNKCLINAENGKRGGRPKKTKGNPQKPNGLKSNPNKGYSDNDSKNDNNNENDKENNIIVLSKDKKEINSYEENGVEKFGNKEINDTLGFLCKIVGIDEFTESQKRQRVYAKHFFNYTSKHGKDEVITRIKGVLSDGFKRKRCNSIRVFYNEVKGYIHTPIVKSEEEERKERLDKIKQMKADLLK